MPTFSYLAGYELVPVQSSYSREKSLAVEKIMRLSRDNLMTHFLRKVPYTSWLSTTDLSKKSGNFGWDFHWERTVPVVHHFLKVSGLSRSASRLDSSYKMKLVRNSRNRKW